MTQNSKASYSFVRFGLDDILDYESTLSLLRVEGWEVEVCGGDWKVWLKESTAEEFFFCLENVDSEIRNKANLGYVWTGVEWELAPLAPENRVQDSEVLDYLVGNNISGLWVHVVNHEPKNWSKYLNELLSLNGEIACSALRIEDELYKTAENRWAVLLEGMSSYVWSADVCSVTDIEGTRYATKVMHTKRTEAWVNPSLCKFKGVIRV